MEVEVIETESTSVVVGGSSMGTEECDESVGLVVIRDD